MLDAMARALANLEDRGTIDTKPGTHTITAVDPLRGDPRDILGHIHGGQAHTNVSQAGFYTPCNHSATERKMANRGQPRYAALTSRSGKVPEMAGAGNGIALGAGGQGRLRVSHADREQVIEVLKVAFVQGRLDGDEFGLRVGRALGSRTYADLAALTADLPAGLTRAQPRRRARKPAVEKSAAAVACASAGFAVVLGALATADGGAFAGLAVGTAAGCFVAALLTVLLLLHAWLEKRAVSRASGGLPPRTGGEASHGVTPTGSAAQPPRISRDPQHRAEAERSRLPLPPLPGAQPSRRGYAHAHRYAIGCLGH